MTAGTIRVTEALLRTEDELRENPKQWEAYSTRGNIVVLAGPGSGKTQVLTARLAKALTYEVAPPRRAACITYSNECVRELHQRFGALGIRRGDLFLGTIHSFAFTQIIRPFAPVVGAVRADADVADGAEAERIYAALAERILGGGAGQQYALRQEFQRYRRLYIHRESEEFLHRDPKYAELVLAYESALQERNLLDFDGMVIVAQRLVEEHEWVRNCLSARYPFLAVDEYQDLGPNLHGMVMALADTGRIEIFAVGDPDQSIYGFQGAQPYLLRSLGQRADFYEVQLDLNYRSRQQIIDAAEAALGEVRGYRAHNAVSEGVVECQQCPGGIEAQAKLIAETIVPHLLASGSARNYGEIAVIYPTAYIGDVMADAMAAAGIEYQRIDNRAPYRQTPLTRLLEDAARWCAGGWKEGDPPLSELLANWRALLGADVSSDEAFRLDRQLVQFLYDHRSAEMPLLEWLESFEQVGLLNYLDTNQPSETEGWQELLRATQPVEGPLAGADLATLAGKGGAPDVINLITIHSAKSRQYDAVVLPGLEEGILPDYRSSTDGAVAEDRRKFFVGISRARNAVHLLYSGFYLTPYGRPITKGPSRFLEEIQEALSRRR